MRIILLLFIGFICLQSNAQKKAENPTLISLFEIEAVSHSAIQNVVTELEYISANGQIKEMSDGQVNIEVFAKDFTNPFESFKRDLVPFKTHKAGTKGVDMYNARDKEGDKIRVTITDYGTHPERYIIRYVNTETWEMYNVVFLVEESKIEQKD